MSGKPTGRKPKLTPEVQEAICQHIETGQYQTVAAQLAGIHEATFFRWLALGDDETDAEGRVTRHAAPRYREFREAVTRAKVRAEAAMALTVRLCAQNGDWKAAAFWLERVVHDRWGRRSRLEHTGKDNGPIQVERADLTKLTDQELAELERLLGRTE